MALGLRTMESAMALRPQLLPADLSLDPPTGKCHMRSEHFRPLPNPPRSSEFLVSHA